MSIFENYLDSRTTPRPNRAPHSRGDTSQGGFGIDPVLDAITTMAPSASLEDSRPQTILLPCNSFDYRVLYEPQFIKIIILFILLGNNGLQKKPRFGKSSKKPSKPAETGGEAISANDLLQRMRERNRLMSNQPR